MTNHNPNTNTITVKKHENICAVKGLNALVASNRNTIYVELKDSSFWETTKVEVRGDRIFAALFGTSVV